METDFAIAESPNRVEMALVNGDGRVRRESSTQSGPGAANRHIGDSNKSLVLRI
jgi:hypothetical protein